MIKSMTGFGRSEAGSDVNKIEVEIKSVNSRFLEIKFRGYTLEPILEKQIYTVLDKMLKRGNIQVRIDFNKLSQTNKIMFNKERFEVIQNVLKEIQVGYGQRINLSDIITTQDLLKSNDSSDFDNADILDAVKNALVQLNQMREKEGQLIYLDLTKRISNLKLIIDKSEKLAKIFSSEKELLLRKKIKELLLNESLDESRLIQEVAYIADRADITEELVRCRSHFEQLDAYMDDSEPVGKKINFLIQEIGREVNTIGSKSHQTEVTKNVIELKAELEKIREQIQNVL
ncbi:MAG: YicC/YloC family endoribonuclease [Fidelibacterota bacterium]|jgi:uncharacterized protein (TIGR00255 family)|tara:strand:- start:2083 stop:2943 length:861 start_codon:yes stop_codon:yes gene_type:complete